jgi:hypothetical protein
MKEQMTYAELELLMKDLKIAAALVFHKHGFDCGLISTIVGVPESTIRNLINTAENINK